MRTDTATEAAVRGGLELESIELGDREDGAYQVLLHSNDGTIATRLDSALDGTDTVIWISGALGGLNGPAGGLYRRLARRLTDAGITSLRLDYRFPNHMGRCVDDVMLGIRYLRSMSRSRIVIVGHSFGGAVAITAGAGSEHVVGVAALSSQTYGADAVADLSPRSLLLIHGTADEILPPACSHYLYARARTPKKMLLYPGATHSLDPYGERIEADLGGWIAETLAAEPGRRMRAA